MDGLACIFWVDWLFYIFGYEKALEYIAGYIIKYFLSIY
jgi:hypothetical protein